MLSFFETNWGFLTTIGVAIVGGAFGLWRFLVSRRAELAWKKTEFIFRQGYYLDTDKELTEIVQILEGRHPRIQLDSLFEENGQLGVEQQMEYLHKLDKFLNLFDRLHMAVFNTKTLSKSEIEPVSWYLSFIDENRSLKKYCKGHGFEGVIELAKKCGYDT